MLNRPGARFLIVGFLALMMAVPLFLVGSIIDGRLSASRRTGCRANGAGRRRSQGRA